MKVLFDQTYLKELYENGKTSDKKHRFQPSIISRYIRGVNILISAPNPEALYTMPSLHYEKLKGDKRGISSIRVNDQYRIEFTEQEILDEAIMTVCNIIELSNHYE